MITVRDVAKIVAGLNDEALEVLAQELYDAENEQALVLMRYIGIMDMESRLTQRDGMAV